MPGRIKLEDSFIDVVCKLSEGNPGAINVMMAWLKQGPSIDPNAIDPIIQLLSLDDMDIVGPDIWIMYKDVCHCDIRTMLAIYRARQLGFTSTASIKQAIRDSQPLPNEADLISKVEEFLPSFARK